MRLGALSAGAVDVMNGMPTGPDSQGYTYGVLANGNDVQCPPGQPYDAALMNCSGAPCLPMIPTVDAAGNVSYSLPQGPLAPGQSICPAPISTTGIGPAPGPSGGGLVMTQNNLLLIGGGILLLILLTSRR